MDVSGVSKNKGARIHQWDCHNGGNQRWILSYRGEQAILTAQHSKMAASIKDDSVTKGADLVQMPNTNNNNQKFYISFGKGGYKIKNSKSGKCLDVYGAGKQNGAKIIQVILSYNFLVGLP